MNRLEEILADSRDRLPVIKAAVPLEKLEDAINKMTSPPDFMNAVRKPPGKPPRLIAEIKSASPSRGILSQDFRPLELARIYRDNGAAAISVLTNRRFFGGDLDHLRQVSALLPETPLLRKDFILEEYQLYEARAAGASAVLLIVAALQEEKICLLREKTEALGMAALVEVHNKPEVEIALRSGSRLVGINNRDLTTFNIHLQTTLDLRRLIPPDVIVVGESGIKSGEDVQLMESAGVDAVLVGEALVTAGNIAARVREFSGGGAHAEN